MRNLKAQTTQMVLPFQSMAMPLYEEPDALKASLEQASGRALSLVLTDNIHSLMSMRPTPSGVQQVRLHRMFLHAPEDVISEIAGYIRTRRGKTPLFWRFVRGNSHMIAKPASENERTMRTRGQHHDLAPLFDALNAEHFGGRLKSSLIWVNGAKGRVKKRTLGSYSPATDTIRINSVLDRKDVPSYYLSFVLYHEMLHADMGIGDLGGRRSMHPREFRERERLYPHFDRATAYELRRGR